VLLLTRYVSLASILGAASFPFFAWMLVRGERPPFFIAVQFAVSLLLIAKHRQNIRRLLDGTESRFGASSQQKGPA
jgi:glycerol-3-phosphate acyltransferase PlsY